MNTPTTDHFPDAGKMTTQEDDVKAIRDALALGPTLGKWSVDGHFGEWGISSDHSVGGACKSGRQFVAACFRVSKKDTPKYAAMFEATARYIAEANPARIARLLARLEQAERHATRYLWLRDGQESDWAICEWANDHDGTGFYRDARNAEIVEAAIDAAMASEKAS